MTYSLFDHGTRSSLRPATIWVGVDASNHNFRGGGFFCKTTGGWVIGCLLLWIVTFPVYLWQRRRAPSRDALPVSLDMATARGGCKIS